MIEKKTVGSVRLSRINKQIIVTHYILGETDNGMCYKDLDAWENGNGIIYIPESEGINHGGTISADEIDEVCAWTKQSWLQYVRDVIEHHNYAVIAALEPSVKEKLVDYIAYNSLYEVEWEELSTFLDSWEWEDSIEDILDFLYVRL